MLLIRFAIVCGPGGDALADSLEDLLSEEKSFTSSRFRYHVESGVKPYEAGFGNPDVIVATLGAFEATDTGPFLASIQRAFPQRPVLVTTTHPDAFDFCRVLEMGASDFLLPPLRRSELLPRLMRQALVTCRGDALVQKLKEDIGLKHIIGESPAFLDKVWCVPRFARCDATVLISGESGTGKEIFARAIHYLSSRADRPFVPVNCGALPENLLESEIFGHKRGAFTGAASDQPGLIREAEGGTLFLDEIDCLTPQAQVKLLRFLQDGEYRSVGSQEILHANIRVVAAANADRRNRAALRAYPGKQGQMILLEQYLLSACVEYCRERKRSPFRGIEMRYLFDSFEDAFHPERATEVGFTHLAAGAKRTARMARHLELRVRHDLPEYYERCVNTSRLGTTALTSKV